MRRKKGSGLEFTLSKFHGRSVMLSLLNYFNLVGGNGSHLDTRLGERRKRQQAFWIPAELEEKSLN